VTSGPNRAYNFDEPWNGPNNRKLARRINDGSGRGLGSRLGGARVVTADTTVRALPDDYDGNKLRAMLTANGGERLQE
jgi:hypothetical protein